LRKGIEECLLVSIDLYSSLVHEEVYYHIYSVSILR
jgi:hypothetical protein